MPTARYPSAPCAASGAYGHEHVRLLGFCEHLALVLKAVGPNLKNHEIVGRWAFVRGLV